MLAIAGNAFFRVPIGTTLPLRYSLMKCRRGRFHGCKHDGTSFPQSGWQRINRILNRPAQPDLLRGAGTVDFDSHLEKSRFVKTKIIATVGPASEDVETMRKLVVAGVDLFRLNFAHGEYDWLEGIVAQIRQLSEELERPLGILGDLCGPKIRLGELPNDVLHCQAGETYEFARETSAEFPKRLTCTYAELVDDLQVGDPVLLADGTVTMRVREKFAEEGRVACVVEQPGDIRSKQGLNLPGVKLSTPSLTPKDLEDLAWAVAHEVDYVGLSFVRSADDVILLRQTIESHQPKTAPHIVSKIEKIEAINDLERILEATDAVMVARGDLGVEVNIAQVPVFQKRIIRLCNQHRIPVITATQMLDSMERNSRPTRAEATDVANAVLDGSDVVMLSGETAIGLYPVDAVITMSRIAHEAERLVKFGADTDSMSSPRTRALAVTEAVTIGAGEAAEHLDADLIVVATHSGRTAMAVSKQRNKVAILGLSDRPDTARRMNLYWGVTPLCTDVVHQDPRKIMEMVVAWGRRNLVISSGDKLVLVASTDWAARGHDLMLVHIVP